MGGPENVNLTPIVETLPTPPPPLPHPRASSSCHYSHLHYLQMSVRVAGRVYQGGIILFWVQDGS